MRDRSPRSACMCDLTPPTTRDARPRIIGQGLHVNFLRPQNARWDLCTHAGDTLSSGNNLKEKRGDAGKTGIKEPHVQL